MTGGRPCSWSRRTFLRDWGRRILLVLLVGLTGRLATRRSGDCGQPQTLACDRCALEAGCRIRGRRVHALKSQKSQDSTTRT